MPRRCLFAFVRFFLFSGVTSFCDGEAEKNAESAKRESTDVIASQERQRRRQDGEKEEKKEKEEEKFPLCVKA